MTGPVTRRGPETLPQAETPSRPGSASGGRPPAPRLPGLPLLAGAVTSLVVAVTLLWRNASLLATPIYEVGDAAANSLLVADARELDLLVGHYSRVGFNHPGPGVLYLQAVGEAVFTDVLGLTPAPYNGQVVAVLLLQAAVVGAVVGVLASWHQRAVVAAATLAVALAWFEAHKWSLSSTWIPLLVIAPFLLLLVSAASVATGRSRHLWLLALSASLLVHAHVEFALFGPALVGAAVATWAWTTRSGPRALWRADPRSWTVALGIAAVFALPIALNTVLNWPGEVPEYFGYSGGQAAETPTLGDALGYARQFWVSDGPLAGLVPVAGVVAAVAAALLAPRPLRLPLVALTGAALLAQALFVVYALVGIDDLGQTYVGLFAHAIPLAVGLVVTVSLGARLATRPVGARALGAASVGVALVAATGDGLLLRSEGIHTLPAVAAQVEQAADGRTVLLDVGEGNAPFTDATGLLAHLEREGEPVCVLTEHLRVQVTDERMCGPEEVADGVVLQLRQPGTSPDPTFPGMQSEITVAS